MEKVDLEKGKKKKKRKMGRSPCCDKEVTKKGAWSPEEDNVLIDYISKNGHGTWRYLPKLAGLTRCGKSCRLRWTNYLRPDIKRGNFSHVEEKTIIHLHSLLGNKWAVIASHLPGRTDNEIKNFWNSRLRKQVTTEISQQQHPQPSSTRHMVQWESARLEAEARLSIEPLLLNSSSAVKSECSDYFLGLWNSEVGESFRNSNRYDASSSSSQSLMSQLSSSTKNESTSGIIIQTNPLKREEAVFDSGSKKDSTDFISGLNSIKYFVMEDLSRTKMNMQLDYSNCHDMEVLQESSDDEEEDVSIYLQDEI